MTLRGLLGLVFGVESVAARSGLAGGLVFCSDSLQTQLFRYWSDFGRFLEAQIDTKISFLDFFESCFGYLMI